MKTKFTLITIFIFAILATATNAKERTFKISKLYFQNTENASLEKGIHENPFNHFTIAEREFSVPGYSEDYSWDIDANSWQHISNTTYTYDFAGNLEEEIVQDSQTDIYLSRNSYTYDEWGNLTEEMYYIRGIDEWVPISGEKSIYTINVEGVVNGIIEQIFEGGEWTNVTRLEYVFNSSGVPIGMQTYKWEGNDWALYSKTVNVSWADWQTKKIAGYTTQYWQNGTWFNGERYSSVYQGNNYTGTLEVWSNTEWTYSRQEFYSINSNEEILILREWTENGWVPAESYITNFDTQGNQTGFFYSSWDGVNWFPEMEFYFDLTYNGIDVTEMQIRYRDPDSEVPFLVSKNVFSSFLHFVKTDVPDDLNVFENVKVFPNPVTNSFQIRIDDTNISNYHVNIVNLAGQTIFSDTFSDPSISIHTEGFVSGMYLLNIKSDEGKTYNSKFLKN